MPLEIDASGDTFTLVVKDAGTARIAFVYTLKDSTLEPFNLMMAIKHYLKEKRENKT